MKQAWKNELLYLEFAYQWIKVHRKKKMIFNVFSNEETNTSYPSYYKSIEKGKKKNIIEK